MKFSTLIKTLPLDKVCGLLLLPILFIGAALKFKFIFQGSLWPDEALYLYIARNLSSDITNLTDISGKLFYQNPPLLMYLLSPFSNMKFIEFDQAARAVVVLMGIGTILITYFIGKKIYHPLVGIIAASFLAVCPLTNWTGVRILTDLPVVFFIYLSICMLVYDKKAAFYFFGLCAVLTKYSAFPVLFLPFFMRMKPKAWAILYFAGFMALSAFVVTKSFYSSPTGLFGYFYGIFNMPNYLHMFKEVDFFVGYFIVGLTTIGMLLTVKEQKITALFHWVCIFGLCRIFLLWVVFRVSRYTLPLYPGLYVFAAYGCYRSCQILSSKWPVYSRWITLFFVVSIASVLYNHSMRSLDILDRTSKAFIGYNEACAFLKNQPDPHSIATASPRQVKYFAPGFDVYDIRTDISPAELREYIEKKKIQYLSIDVWSPHLPLWCRSFDYKKKGYDLIYEGQNIYVFKATIK